MNYVVSVVRVGLVWDLSPLFSRSFCRCSSMKHLGAKLIVSTVMNPPARRYEKCFLKRLKKNGCHPKTWVIGLISLWVIHRPSRNPRMNEVCVHRHGLMVHSNSIGIV